MKNVIIGLVLCMLLIGMAGFVSAEKIKNANNTCGNGICEKGEKDDPGGCGPNADPRCLGPPAIDGTCPQDCSLEEENEDNNKTNQGLGQIIRNRVKAGVYTSPEGYEIRVSEMAQNRTRLMVGNKSADCNECNISEERENNKTRLKIHLSNGKDKEIKIMPDTASEKALERLKLKVCNETNNCTIQLKEVGKKNETKAAYEIQVERHRKLLGLFRIKSLEKAQVDVETGEVIVVKKPWWAFLATDFD